MKNSNYIFLILIFIFSCGKKNQDNLEDNTPEKPLLSVVKKHPKIEPINPIFESEITDWEELKTVNSFLKKFENVSPNEALTNALELRDLTKSLKDSVKPKLFDTPALNARINVFYNETLRLADITFIPAATAKDVNLQISKTINTFSSINSKISTILLKKKFEEEVDVDFNFIGLDSTKIDSITKKSIDQKMKDIRLMDMKGTNNLKKSKEAPLKPIE